MIISNYRAVDKGALIAAFDLELTSGIKIIGAMLMRNDGGDWISFPGIPFEKDGKKCYKNVLEIPDRTVRDKFNAAVIACLATEVSDGAGSG